MSAPWPRPKPVTFHRRPLNCGNIPADRRQGHIGKYLLKYYMSRNLDQGNLDQAIGRHALISLTLQAHKFPKFPEVINKPR